MKQTVKTLYKVLSNATIILTVITLIVKTCQFLAIGLKEIYPDIDKDAELTESIQNETTGYTN